MHCLNDNIFYSLLPNKRITVAVLDQQILNAFGKSMRTERIYRGPAHGTPGSEMPWSEWSDPVPSAGASAHRFASAFF